MNEKPLSALQEALEIAFDLLTDEQFAEYQRRRRARHIERCDVAQAKKNMIAKPKARRARSAKPTGPRFKIQF